MPIRYDPLALDELIHAWKWYSRRSAGVANRFRAEISIAEKRIEESPEAWTRYFRGTQYYRLKRFPYLVIYRVRQQVIEIIAVAHAKRRPGYWTRRLK